MNHRHHYAITTTWTGNLGSGTANYRAYSRNHEFTATGKSPLIPGSSDPQFRGDGSRYNPEELLVASLSACHMLWLLHLCADNGIVVTRYEDHATGTMAESADGGGEFVEVLLRPEMEITDAARIEEALQLHDRAHHLCYIARSVKFPVRHEASVTSSGCK